MNKKLIYSLFLLIIVTSSLISSVSALSVNYFYSPSCSHCESIKDFINNMKEKYSFHEWNFINVQEEKINVPVPTLEIDGKTFIGSQEIPMFAEKYLNCNPDIQPQTICIKGQPYTKATPNYERPCSAPILFGGKN